VARTSAAGLVTLASPGTAAPALQAVTLTAAEPAAVRMRNARIAPGERVRIRSMKRIRVGDNAAVDDRSLVRLSKRMSLALRHTPERFGLVVDAGGWVRVDDVLAALGVTRAELDAVVAGNDKQRFAVQRGTDAIDRIRASQGHSLSIDLGLAAQSPPRWLYHGTSAAALDSIRATGLHRARRHHVHLSADLDTARRVGARRAGPVVVLTVDAQAMADDGLLFYRSANGVWLTDAVPARYLQSSNVE